LDNLVTRLREWAKMEVRGSANQIQLDEAADALEAADGLVELVASRVDASWKDRAEAAEAEIAEWKQLAPDIRQLRTDKMAAEARVEEWDALAQMSIHNSAEAIKVIDGWKARAEEWALWAGRMPDAGFNDQDPRWQWWHEKPQNHSEGTKCALCSANRTSGNASE